MDLAAASSTFSTTLFETSKLLSSPTLTLVRDGTDAGDGVALSLQLARTVVSTAGTDASQILLLSTRSRTSFNMPDSTLHSPHIYPIASRDTVASVSSCVVIDPFSECSITPSSREQAIQDMYRVVSTRCLGEDGVRHVINQPRLLVIECLHSLRFAFSVDPSAFIRSVMSGPLCMSVIAAAPTAGGIDIDIANLSSISHNVIDLSDLQTGVATEVDGIIKVTKREADWVSCIAPKRYKLTATAFAISS